MRLWSYLPRVSPDNILIDAWMFLADKAVNCLTKLFNMMLNSERIPEV